jgi:hypothetical protein
MKQEQKPMRQAQKVEAKRDPERKLLERAREAAVAAERLATCRKELHQVSTDTARNARKDIAEAIGYLQDLAQLLRDKIGQEVPAPFSLVRFLSSLPPQSLFTRATKAVERCKPAIFAEFQEWTSEGFFVWAGEWWLLQPQGSRARATLVRLMHLLDMPTIVGVWGRQPGCLISCSLFVR